MAVPRPLLSTGAGKVPLRVLSKMGLAPELKSREPLKPVVVVVNWPIPSSSSAMTSIGSVTPTSFKTRKLIFNPYPWDAARVVLA